MSRNVGWLELFTRPNIEQRGTRVGSRELDSTCLGSPFAIRLFAALAIATLVAAAVPAVATAQDYPAKPLRFIVGYLPGAAIDFTARVFADWLKTTSGQ